MSKQKWHKDLENSRDAFVDLVAPVLEEWTGGEVANVESVTEDSVANHLDQLAGVDAWDIRTSDGIRGVASRCQPQGPYSTFTIRKWRRSQEGTPHETEFEKRRRQINNDLLYPHYTVQAYYDEDNWKLQSAAKTRTKDLIKFIESGQEGDSDSWYGDGFGDGDYWVKETYSGDERFYCVEWEYLIECGVGVQFTEPHKDSKERVAPRSQSGLDSFSATSRGGIDD